MPGPTPLAPDRIAAALAALPGWTHTEGSLCRSWRFADFPAAMAWMQDAAQDIERLGHHPEWSNVRDLVTVVLRTHEAGGRVTTRDVELAKILHRLADGHGAA